MDLLGPPKFEIAPIKPGGILPETFAGPAVAMAAEPPAAAASASASARGRGAAAAGLEGHTARVWGLAWRPDGGCLVSCGADRSVRRWRAGPGPGLGLGAAGALEGVSARTVRSVAWDPAGACLAAAAFDATLSVWREVEAAGAAEATEAVEPFELATTLEGHENEVKGVAWNASGAYLACCSRDKTVWVWERAPTGTPGGAAGAGAADVDVDFECLDVLQGHTQDVKSVAWHPRLDVLVSAGYDATVRVWTEEAEGLEWACAQVLDEHRATVWDLAFDAAGAHLASCDAAGTVRVWRFDAAELGRGAGPFTLAATLAGVHAGPTYSLDWSAGGGGRLAAGGAGGAVCVLAPETAPDGQVGGLRVDLRLQGHGLDVNCVRWKPAGGAGGARVLATASDDETIKIWAL